MSRRFFRNFFDFHDPFIFPSVFHRPLRVQFRQLRPIEREAILPRNQTRNAHEVFENFFNQNGITEGEKDFFKKNFPQKVQQKSDPYKILEIQKDATQDQIKQAYRKLAIKYHPKNNSDPQAQAKFLELAKAYEQALEAKNQVKYSDLGFKSFFQDFDKEVRQVFGTVKDSENKKIENGTKGQQVGEKKNSFGELYSESSNVQNINGKQTKFVCQKKYKKDGKSLSVKREETLKEDGNTEILETIDDGKQVKKKQYILGKDKKETKKIEQK